MQTLYALDSLSDQTKPGEPISILNKKIDQSKQLFTYLVYFITETARYAETDANKKASKNLPTAADLATNTKIAGNEILWKIVEDISFKGTVNELKAHLLIDQDLLKKTYRNLIETPEYIEYIEEQSRDKKSEKKMLEFIFTDLMLPNEDFINHIEEHFINWDDDAEMMHSLVLSYLSKPGQQNFQDFLSAEKRQFAKDLLLTVLDKTEQTLELIKPKLKNWDADRIASLDLILLQMGVCEFLYFETIPTKVTINEYIDLAKAYSTPQSGQFVNGLLDNIHKELQAANKLDKRNFKDAK
ncbi:transcription antitermination factor NusB [Ferruginibacter yonginensis]|uniref:Transcription antitermination protein NusB n=1 Tax=Ferruginibacter yonginensis TaxID=1310416 RepID=A0ABV8QPT6_9BACT